MKEEQEPAQKKARPPDRSGVAVKKEPNLKKEPNGVFVVGLSDYESATSDSSDSWEKAPPARTQPQEVQAAKAAKRRVKMKAVLEALGADAHDDETAEKLARLQRQVRKKKAKGQGYEDRDVTMDPSEILAILPHLSREEKARLYRELKAEHESEAYRRLPKEPKEESGARSSQSRRESPPAAPRTPPSTAAASASAGVKDPFDPNTPPVLRKKRLADFRRGLYDGALGRKGKLTLSEAADLPTADQERCAHAFDDLRWGANSSAHWAHCGRCKLKKVLYYSVTHGVLVTGPPKGVQEVILDTGCRTAVAGAKWHEAYQRHLRELGLQWLVVTHEEIFRFGAGKPVLSTEAMVYPIQIGATRSWLRLAVVASEGDPRVADCPALVGPSEMARLDVKMDFAQQSISVAGEPWQALELSATRHPVVDVVPAPGADQGDWDVAPLRELRERLCRDPYSLALLQDQLELVEDDGAVDPEEVRSESEAMSELGEDESFLHEAAAWQVGLEDEAIRKWDELALPQEAFRASSRRPPGTDSD